MPVCFELETKKARTRVQCSRGWELEKQLQTDDNGHISQRCHLPRVLLLLVYVCMYVGRC
jgi:hypothetical protein